MEDIMQGIRRLAVAVPSCVINKFKLHSCTSLDETEVEDKERFKIEIGSPSNFKHVSHVGWDPDKGIDVNLDLIRDPYLKKFFEKAGVNDAQLKDSATRKIIFDFIKENGGLYAVINDVSPQATPAPSPVSPNKPNLCLFPSTPVGQVPVPPPTPALSFPPIPPPMEGFRSLGFAHPPATIAAVGPNAPINQCSALIQSIVKLQQDKLENECVTDSRKDLLHQIEKGVILKTTHPGILKPKGLASQLADVLRERMLAVHLSDSESDDVPDGDPDNANNWE